MHSLVSPPELTLAILRHIPEVFFTFPPPLLLISQVFAHLSHARKLLPVVLAREIRRLQLHNVALVRLPEPASGIPNTHNRDAAATRPLVSNDKRLPIEAAVKTFIRAFEFV